MTTFISRRGFLIASTALAGLALLPRMAQAAPQRGGRLVVAGDSEPRNLNPAIVASNGVFFIASKVIEPLAEASYDGENHLEPRLATSWQGSDDGLSATFKLREGVKWHDGQAFTAADVAFSAMQVWKPLQNLGRVVFKALERVDTPDDHTAIFHFSEPTPFQLIRNALPALTAVLPKHIYEGTDIAKNPANEQLIGTGPFKYAEHKPGEYYRLVRNESYWSKEQPYLDDIIYKILPDRAAAAGALEAGEVDLAAFSAVPLADLDRIGKVADLSVITKGYEALTYQLVVEINHRRKELADLKVRQAIAHAIDRDFVVRTIFLGHAKPSTGIVPAYDGQFYTGEVAQYEFSIDKANQLLDAAGYPRGADGKRFQLKLLPAPYFNETKQFGDYLRQALAPIGIDAQLVNNDAAAHQKAVYSDHNFDLAIAPTVYRGDPAISTTILVQSGLPAGVPFSNQGGYANQSLDQLIDKAAHSVDDKQRSALYRSFQQQVAADLPLINVAEWGFTSVANKKLQNIANNPRWATANWADLWIEQ